MTTFWFLAFIIILAFLAVSNATRLTIATCYFPKKDLTNAAIDNKRAMIEKTVVRVVRIALSLATRIPMIRSRSTYACPQLLSPGGSDIGGM